MVLPGRDQSSPASEEPGTPTPTVQAACLAGRQRGTSQGACLMDSKAPSLEQHCHSTAEFSAVMDLLYTVPSRAAATRHMWPVSTCNVASVREESNFSFYFILINFNLWATCG